MRKPATVPQQQESTSLQATTPADTSENDADQGSDDDGTSTGDSGVDVESSDEGK